MEESTGDTGIHFVFRDMLFYSQKPVATDLHFKNHQGPRFQLNIFKVAYILDSLRRSKLTAVFNCWMNCAFNLCIVGEGTMSHNRHVSL